MSGELAAARRKISGKAKNLYRKDTKTDWDENVISDEILQMKEEMDAQRKDALTAMMDKNDELRFVINEDAEVDYKAFPDEDEVDEKKKLEMKKEMQKLLQSQKAALADQINKNLYHHEQEESSQVPIEPHGHNFNEIEQQQEMQQEKQEQMQRQQEEEEEAIALQKENEERDKADMRAEMQKLQKERLEKQIQRSAELTQGVDTANKLASRGDDDAAAMRAHYQQVKKDELDRRTDINNDKTTEPQINSLHKGQFNQLMDSIGILNEVPRQELWQQIDEIVNGDKRAPIPQKAHSISKSQLMDREEIRENIDFKEELDETAITELRAELQSAHRSLADKNSQIDSIQIQLDSKDNEIQQQQAVIATLKQDMETLQLKQQQELEDMRILETERETPQGPTLQGDDDDNTKPIYIQDTDGMAIQSTIQYETPIGPDPNQVPLLTDNDNNNNGGLQQRVDALTQEKVAMKDYYDKELKGVRDEIKENQREINELNEEIKRIGLSKIQLLENTSKEIDSLRSLLSEYVRIANQQKNRNNR